MIRVGKPAPKSNPLAQELIIDLEAVGLSDQGHLRGWALIAVGTSLLVALLWAAFAELDVLTRGTGEVVPSRRGQVIQSLEGGILSALNVREGQAVKRGQVLLKIDDTRSASAFRQDQYRVDGLRATLSRLQAEAHGTGLAFPAGLPAHIVQAERAAYASRQAALQANLSTVRQSLKLADDELRITAPLAAKGVVSEVEILRLQRQVSELKGKLEEIHKSYRAEASAELSRIKSEMEAINAGNEANRDSLRRTAIEAPLDGVVKAVKVTTLGGVIQPGQEIMEIVPTDDQLVIEARIRPEDVAFLRPGLPAKIKITAYDYAIYGGLDGKVENISADTLKDEYKREEPFYRVRVSTASPQLKDKSGKTLPVIPGMIAEVEIMTARRTVLDYLLKPISRARGEALTER